VQGDKVILSFSSHLVQGWHLCRVLFQYSRPGTGGEGGPWTRVRELGRGRQGMGRKGEGIWRQKLKGMS
jgi:hypothetical protein